MQMLLLGCVLLVPSMQSSPILNPASSMSSNSCHVAQAEVAWNLALIDESVQNKRSLSSGKIVVVA